jgi:hypothetical protein
MTPYYVLGSIKRFSIFTVLISSLFLSSCGEDEEPNDGNSPSVSFKELTTNAEVWNTVNVALNASDDNGVHKIEVLVDGAVITTLETAPYEYSWDSNSVPDGEHTVTVIAYDQSGNKQTAEIKVIVKNVLVSTTIGSDILNEDEGYSKRGFIFLSDEAGKLIAFKEYQNGEKVELKSTTFNGQTFYLTESILETSLDREEIRFFTYPVVKRGSNWIVFDEHDTDPNYVGTASLNFSNAASGYEYITSTNGDISWVNEMDPSAESRLLKSPSKLLVVKAGFETGASHYKLFTNIVTGNNVTINLNQVTEPLSLATAALPAGTEYASVDLIGYPVANDFTEGYEIDGIHGQNGDGTQMSIRYPGNAFPMYYSECYYETSNVYFSSASRTTLHDFTPFEYDFSVTMNDSAMTYTASGNYDVFIPYYYQDEAFSWMSWAFILPLGADKTVVVPELPTQLEEYYSIDMSTNPSVYTIADFEGMSNYDDMKNKIATSARGLTDFYALGKNYKDMQIATDAPGGRRKKHGKLKRRFIFSSN